MCEVSVIIPVYNREKELMIPVNSILGQNYKNWELLLVDDGSTDGSALLCDQLAAQHEKIRVIHQKNGGVSSARNVGLDNAKGKYILFVDSDDWIEEDTLWHIVEQMEQDQSDMVAFAMQIDRFGKGEIHSTKSLYGKSVKMDKKELGIRFADLYQKDYLCSACTKLFKKSVIDQHDIRFRTDLVMYEDFYFVMDYLMKATEISVVNRAYYHYRMDETVVLIHKRKTDDLLENLDIVVAKIALFTEEFGAYESKDVQKIIFEFYIMYFYKLFVSEYRFRERIREIKRIFHYDMFQRSEVLSRGTDQGKFYKILRWAIRNKNSIAVYCLYRRRYKVRKRNV